MRCLLCGGVFPRGGRGGRSISGQPGTSLRALAQAQRADRIGPAKQMLAAVAAGRAEALRLHRSGRIHDEVLHALEHDLDLQELSAERMRDGG